jgi:hypothetical protein
VEDTPPKKRAPRAPRKSASSTASPPVAETTDQHLVLLKIDALESAKSELSHVAGALADLVDVLTDSAATKPEIEATHKAVLDAEKARRRDYILIAAVAILVLVTVIAVGWINHRQSADSQKQRDLIIGCTTPGPNPAHKCFNDSNSRTGELIIGLDNLAKDAAGCAAQLQTHQHYVTVDEVKKCVDATLAADSHPNHP